MDIHRYVNFRTNGILIYTKFTSKNLMVSWVEPGARPWSEFWVLEFFCAIHHLPFCAARQLTIPALFHEPNRKTDEYFITWRSSIFDTYWIFWRLLTNNNINNMQILRKKTSRFRHPENRAHLERIDGILSKYSRFLHSKSACYPPPSTTWWGFTIADGTASVTMLKH